MMNHKIESILPVDVVLVSRIAKKYVHYDIEVYYKGRPVGIQRSLKNERSLGNVGIFPIDAISEYIASDDKKSFRKEYNIFEDYVTWEYFDIFGVEFFCQDKQFLKDCGVELEFSNMMGSWRPPHLIWTSEVLKVSVVPIYICPTCSECFEGSKFSGRIEDYLDQSLYKFKRCSSCASTKYRDSRRSVPAIKTTFFSKINSSNRFFDFNKDPRAFLYQAKEEPKKSFFKKYISRHLTRVRKQRSISPGEVSFFRSWLGAKDIAALAN